jgi:hypothetical protein
MYKVGFSVAILFCGTCLYGQELGLNDYLQRLKVTPGTSIEQKVEFLHSMGVSLSAHGVSELDAATTTRPAPRPAAPFGSPQLRSPDGTNKYLGDVNNNPYDPNSVANPYGPYGSPYSPDSVNNPYGIYGSPYSPHSATNPYTTQAPMIVTPGGKYLGRDSANPYDPDSTSNQFGRYGSPYSSDSINNPYGPYGSPYSFGGATNPYGTGAVRPAFPALPALPALPSLPKLPALPKLPLVPVY